MTATAPTILHLSLVTSGELTDADGRKLGRIEDLVVRIGEDDYPPITGAVAKVAGRLVFVAAEQIGAIQHGRITLTKARLDLQPFERREGELLLREDLLDRQVINVDGARIVRANEIEIARIEGWWRVVGIDITPKSLLRRLLPRAIAPQTVGVSGFLDWASLEPFTGHIPTITLRVPHPKLARLHPAELADLVEAAPHGQGEEIIAAVRHNPELEADLFEELGDEHQLEFAEDRDDHQVADLMARMEIDDAADLLGQFDDDRRSHILELLPQVQQRRLRALLGYEPLTAGGLMSPDFVAVFSQASQAEVLDRVRRAATPSDALVWIFAINTHHRFRGAVSLPDLVRAEPDTAITDLISHSRSVTADADLDEIVRAMTDYDLTVVPVVDDDQRPIGIITVDDVLELIAPPPGRGFGIFGGS
ncbi:MAG TPA: CBS domain-containing protein [Gaiellaceae bacterium]|nr:CBS domain-containing protein [Gaiellaceae bacterium]